MLLQLQQLHQNGGREFIAQSDFSDHLTQEEFAQQYTEWSNGVTKRHELPSGSEWCIDTETSKHFMRAP